MKKSNVAVFVVGILGVFFWPALQAWGEPSFPAPGSKTCVVNNPGKGALAIKGTVAVEVVNGFNAPRSSQDVDFTLRLERSGAQHFFRLHLVTELGAMSNEAIACRMLNPNDTDDLDTENVDPDEYVSRDVSTLVNQILTTFDLPGRRLVITDSSISDAGEPEPIPGTETGFPIPGTYPSQPAYHRGSSLVNIVIYAVPSP